MTHPYAAEPDPVCLCTDGPLAGRVFDVVPAMPGNRAPATFVTLDQAHRYIAEPIYRVPPARGAPYPYIHSGPADPNHVYPYNATTREP